AKLPTLISHLEWTLGYAKELNRNAGYSPDYIAKCNNIVSENLAAIVAIAAMPQAGGEVGAKALRSTGRESPDYLKVLEDACWDLRCVSDPIADTGDADVLWQVVGHWMSKPHDRVIGYGYSPLAAIKDAQRPRDYEGNLIEDEDDQPKPPASAGSEGA
ncbi:MAG: hypothetical protein JWN34_1538, partial [Bryobacterales bacterium]|nr:hypothetical protein [Bryobacterales bacterium]